MCGINTGAQGSPRAKELWTWQQAGQTHQGDKQKTDNYLEICGSFWHGSTDSTCQLLQDGECDCFQIVVWIGVRDEAIYKGKSNFDNKIVVFNFP